MGLIKNIFLLYCAEINKCKKSNEISWFALNLVGILNFYVCITSTSTEWTTGIHFYPAICNLNLHIAFQIIYDGNFQKLYNIYISHKFCMQVPYNLWCRFSEIIAIYISSWRWRLCYSNMCLGLNSLFGIGLHWIKSIILCFITIQINII